ncbi:hypothetical protein CLV51_1011353 [Chitinophaga niastensis]|uniref:Uncharacterized protein n=1 Tax=Chitinophaga niastensis TaxID=536980 RepID=A0A2P8HUV1_CHINA|nr:hypothetical protein [Chitinophaga niastensis]PSL50010.1 hypothetical protein CLV51_1011353 [Chitinophaga niastensis]
MLVVLIFSTTPHDFVHLFANHKDTVDVQRPDSPLVISEKHTHCDFLNISLAPFLATFSPLLQMQVIVFEARIITIPDSFHNVIALHPSLRAPPVAC